MTEIILSILTPAVPSRFSQAENLAKNIATQIGERPVEHLIFLDNKRRTVGEKRDTLLRSARGRYVAFVDDDDWISEDYVTLIMEATRSDADVITFRQQADVNNQRAIIEFGLGNENEAFGGRSSATPGSQEFAPPIIRRNAWHICAWRRTLAIQSHFPCINYGEDWAFAEPLCKIAETSQHIPKVLHYYRHSSETTEAPPDKPPTPFMDSLHALPGPDAFHLATGR